MVPACLPVLFTDEGNAGHKCLIRLCQISHLLREADVVSLELINLHNRIGVVVKVDGSLQSPSLKLEISLLGTEQYAQPHLCLQVASLLQFPLSCATS